MLAAISFYVGGCGGRTNLERASGQLKQGMDSASVRAVFADFPHSNYATDSVEVLFPTKRFQKDSRAAAHMRFDSNEEVFLFGRLPEWCTVYFDTNGVIVAYQYCCMH